MKTKTKQNKKQKKKRNVEYSSLSSNFESFVSRLNLISDTSIFSITLCKSLIEFVAIIEYGSNHDFINDLSRANSYISELKCLLFNAYRIQARAFPFFSNNTLFTAKKSLCKYGSCA